MPRLQYNVAHRGRSVTQRRARLRSRTIRNRILLGLALVVVFVYVNNRAYTSPAARPLLLAHRGLGQDFVREGITGDTCTATRILPPEHPFLEDTIPAMAAAFAYGAAIVEFDVHPTTDGNFAVFHDWTLACRTNGTGVTREQTLGYLKSLDAGYGYTADGGQTFPFRGQGIGMIPALDEVLSTFPERNFLINIKSNDPHEGALLAATLRQLPSAQQNRLMVYGAELPIAVVRAQLPHIRTMSRASLEGCLLRYVAFGWSGYLPPHCNHTMLLIPGNVAPWLWGWPRRFMQRMDRIGTRVFLVNDYTGGGFSEGLNSLSDLEKVPPAYTGGIWTDRIDIIGPAVDKQAAARSTP